MVVLAGDVTRLALAGKRLETGFNINTFTDVVKQCLGKGGTLVIPAYNFNLRNNDQFHPKRSAPITGSLAVAALNRTEFIRTSHPLHSFLAWGEQAEALAALSNRSSFDERSPFAFFREHKALMLLVDTTVAEAFTFVHHVEEMEKVKYRRYKKLIIKVEGENGQINGKEILIYAKKPGWTMDMKGLEEILFREKVAKKQSINKVSFIQVDLAAAFPLIRDDIRNNRGRNISRFSFKLLFREMSKSVLQSFGFRTLGDKISHDHGLL
jgi:aminoglycoside 3-N-acetyltransferase